MYISLKNRVVGLCATDENEYAGTDRIPTRIFPLLQRYFQ